MNPNSLSVLNLQRWWDGIWENYGRRKKGELNISISKLIFFQLCPQRALRIIYLMNSTHLNVLTHCQKVCQTVLSSTKFTIKLIIKCTIHNLKSCFQPFKGHRNFVLGTCKYENINSSTDNMLTCQCPQICYYNLPSSSLSPLH